VFSRPLLFLSLVVWSVPSILSISYPPVCIVTIFYRYTIDRVRLKLKNYSVALAAVTQNITQQ